MAAQDFFLIFGAVLLANLCTVGVVYAFTQIGRHERENKPIPVYLLSTIIIPLGMLIAAIYSLN